MCKNCFDAIEAALDAEHPCDDEYGCDIAQARDHGWFAWAAHLLQGATECPETDFAVGVYIGRHGQETWDALCETQRGYLARVPHLNCPHCNAGCWEPEDVDECPECGKSLDSWFVIPVRVTCEDDWTDVASMIFRAKGREIAEGTQYDSGSFEELVCDGDAAVWGQAIVDAYDGSDFELSDRGFCYNLRPCDCGDEGCDAEDSDHDSQTVCAQWESTGWKAFATRELAEAHARSEYVNQAVVFVNEK